MVSADFASFFGLGFLAGNTLLSAPLAHTDYASPDLDRLGTVMGDVEQSKVQLRMEVEQFAAQTLVQFLVQIRQGSSVNRALGCWFR